MIAARRPPAFPRRRRAAVVGLALAAACLLAPAPATARSRVGGVIADIPTGGRVSLPPVAHAASLGYSGGRVLHWNRTHLIFWAPAGSGLQFDPGYEGQIARFLSAVAADSRRATNVYSLSGQYTDSGGPAAYASTYGGAVLDKSPLPARGCEAPGPPHGPGWSDCVTDAQVQQELGNIVGERNLPTGNNDVYFICLPAWGSAPTEGPRVARWEGVRTATAATTPRRSTACSTR
jgi:hypothetical protein